MKFKRAIILCDALRRIFIREGLAVLAVCHVVGHDAHDDSTQVEEDVGQDLRAKGGKKKQG